MTTRGFIVKALLLAAPFALVMAAAAIIDPYCMFSTNGVIPSNVKQKVLDHDGRSMAFNHLLWNMLEHQRTPCEHALLGDSRLTYFDLSHLKLLSGTGFSNLGVAGGNYRTIGDLFDHLEHNAHLKSLYIQVSFRGAKKGFDHDLMTQPRTIAESPFLYLTDRHVLKTAALDLLAYVAPDQVKFDELPDDQWQRVLSMEEEMTDGFTLNNDAFTTIERIARTCKAKGIRLMLIEYPVHEDVLTIYEKEGLVPLQKEFSKRMSALAPYIDLATLQLDDEFWRDPLHLTVEGQRRIAEAIWARSQPRQPGDADVLVQSRLLTRE